MMGNSMKRMASKTDGRTPWMRPMTTFGRSQSHDNHLKVVQRAWMLEIVPTNATTKICEPHTLRTTKRTIPGILQQTMRPIVIAQLSAIRTLRSYGFMPRLSQMMSSGVTSTVLFSRAIRYGA